MAKGINRVILVGNLGQDPEVRHMPNGSAVTNISIATSESWKDKQTGEAKEKTEWHRVVIFGKLAEIAAEYLKKGSQVYIEGALQTRKWQDNAGVERYATEVVVNVGGMLQMLGSRARETVFGQNDNVSSVPSNPTAKNTSTQVNHPIDFDDDIPFASIGLQYPKHTIHAI